MSRYIDDVHKKIYDAIPSSEIEFRNELKEYIESIWNKAPEVRKSSETYIPYYLILKKYIPDLENLSSSEPIWHVKCRNIFCNIDCDSNNNQEQSFMC